MRVSEHEIAVLTNIYSHSDSIRQREMAKTAGVSLGMANAIIKRLATKGWITIRKANSRRIRYAVTPAGIDQITRRSYMYVRQTIERVVSYREAIESVIREVKASGYEAIILVGSSQLDFVVEYVCGLHRLVLLREDPKEHRKAFRLYSETYEPASARGATYLRALLGE